MNLLDGYRAYQLVAHMFQKSREQRLHKQVPAVVPLALRHA